MANGGRRFCVICNIVLKSCVPGYRHQAQTPGFFTGRLLKF